MASSALFCAFVALHLLMAAQCARAQQSQGFVGADGNGDLLVQSAPGKRLILQGVDFSLLNDTIRQIARNNSLTDSVVASLQSDLSAKTGQISSLEAEVSEMRMQLNDAQSSIAELLRTNAPTSTPSTSSPTTSTPTRAPTNSPSGSNGLVPGNTHAIAEYDDFLARCTRWSGLVCTRAEVKHAPTHQCSSYTYRDQWHVNVFGNASPDRNCPNFCVIATLGRSATSPVCQSAGSQVPGLYRACAMSTTENQCTSSWATYRSDSHGIGPLLNLYFGNCYPNYPELAIQCNW